MLPRVSQIGVFKPLIDQLARGRRTAYASPAGGDEAGQRSGTCRAPPTPTAALGRRAEAHAACAAVHATRALIGLSPSPAHATLRALCRRVGSSATCAAYD